MGDLGERGILQLVRNGDLGDRGGSLREGGSR